MPPDTLPEATSWTTLPYVCNLTKILSSKTSLNPKWLSASGELCLDTYSYAGNKKMTCFVVDVEDITYLYDPKHDPAEKTAISPKKSKLQDKFKK
jgi:hypothetical protein